MTNRPKQVGTWAESEVVKSIRARGVAAQRIAQQGSNDLSDVWAWPLQTGGARVALEVKSGTGKDTSQIRNPSWHQIGQWFAEAYRESTRVPGCELAVLVVKRQGSGKADDWFAYVLLNDYVELTVDYGPNRGTLTDHGIVAQIRLGHLLDHLTDHYARNPE